MNFHSGSRILVTLGLLVSWMGVGSLAAQDERTLGWSDVAEATFVLTAGNATASTLGFKNTAEHLWEKASFKLSAGATTHRVGNHHPHGVGDSGELHHIRRSPIPSSLPKTTF